MSLTADCPLALRPGASRRRGASRCLLPLCRRPNCGAPYLVREELRSLRIHLFGKEFTSPQMRTQSLRFGKRCRGPTALLLFTSMGRRGDRMEFPRQCSCWIRSALCLTAFCFTFLALAKVGLAQVNHIEKAAN